MTAADQRISAQLARDLAVTLAKLRLARTVGDEQEIRISEKRLNWLLESQIPRKANA
jgi:hypothetical protein